jgi:hypothetical protein
MIDYNRAARIQTNCTVSNRMKSIDASRKATNILLHLKGTRNDRDSAGSIE